MVRKVRPRRLRNWRNLALSSGPKVNAVFEWRVMVRCPVCRLVSLQAADPACKCICLRVNALNVWHRIQPPTMGAALRDALEVATQVAVQADFRVTLRRASPATLRITSKITAREAPPEALPYALPDALSDAVRHAVAYARQDALKVASPAASKSASRAALQAASSVALNESRAEGRVCSRLRLSSTSRRGSRSVCCAPYSPGTGP
jgi:hypothetical protein